MMELYRHDLDECPECGEHDVSFSDPEFYDKYLSVKCLCGSCNAWWIDEYRYLGSTEPEGSERDA